MKKYNLINNIGGWFCFLVAAIVYILTVEPTASFWDCGEFISSSYKLEVGHPPGAPFFMLTAKLFTLFASDASQVAIWVNRMSALLSAATILFLFWTITYFTRRLVYTDKSKEMTLGQTIAIIGSGLVGALVYTFTDTFWFSAVEGEVYAYSSMFTALVFWLILKWESRADKPGSDKWLVLIAYCMGLSIGVHLLNLLCIPAIGLVYYYKKAKKTNALGTLITVGISFLLIVFLMYGIIPGFTKVGGWFELFFVNSLGFSYNSGSLFYLAILLGSIIWGLFETFSQKGSLKRAKIALIVSIVLSGVPFISSNGLISFAIIGGFVMLVILYKKLDFRWINTTLLCLLVILIGYSSFALIPIRSTANTPMDQNSPENVFTLASYLNREQYGDNPLFFGRTYASDVERDENNAPVVSGEKKNWDEIVKKSPNEKDRYYVASTSPTYKYTNEMLFPRMYSDVPRHLQGYRVWGNMKDQKTPPTFFDNIQFFLSYQLNYMYFRYFMWNFSGRQNDIQGTGNISNGNWLTGIGFFDENVLGLGPQDNLPPDIAANKGHNVYYALPFILGLIGIAYQLTRGRKGEQQFLVTFMLFFMTGIAIILYLNQQPYEPRERDYAYAGSFYAFSIWIGFGVAAIWNLLKKKIPGTPAAILVTVLLLLVPIQMACQNWDDHDRSNRYSMRDFGENYLSTCEPNAILFTNGDNDTFPLWYAQEVEGYRTDVRVCNLSYLQTDWYVDQMRRQAYKSDPLPINWDRDRYMGDKGRAALILSRSDLERIVQSQIDDSNKRLFGGYIDYSRFFDTAAYKNEMLLDDALQIVKTKDKYLPRNEFYKNVDVVIPANKLVMPIDTTKVDWKALGTKPATELVFDMSKSNALYRQELMILEMLNNINKDGWKRPIYYAVTIGDYPLNINGQLVFEGIDLRILPGKTNSMRVNTEKMYDNMMNKYKWGNVADPNVYLDENILRMCRTFRMMFGRLISALIEEKKDDMALKALDRCMEVLPGNTIPRAEESVVFANSYYILGEKAKADSILSEIHDRAEQSLQWYARLDQQNMVYSSMEIRNFIDTELTTLNLYSQFDKQKYEKLLPKIMNYMQIFMSNRVVFDNRDHPLDYLYYMVAHNQQQGDKSEDSIKKSQELLSQIFNMMQRYDPRLLEKYNAALGGKE